MTVLDMNNHLLTAKLEPSIKPGEPALEPLLTLNDLGTVLRFSSKTIGRLIASGGLPPPILIGKSYRWRRSDIDRFLSHQAEDIK